MQTGPSGERDGKLFEPGDIFGDYVVEKLLGKGGMGAVYLMRAPDGRRYAVKVMDADAAQKNQDFLKRFLREAEFAVRIRHPNLIPVHRVGKEPTTGLCYLVMDYMPGGCLTDRLDRCKRLSVEEAISIVVQIAGALEVAHRNGVIHRDIKPDNILFDIYGMPKLADLGVAKFSGSVHKTTVTTTGMIIGTPAYMAPEQMMDSHHVDARADIYSLGVVFFEMLTGSRPHEGSTIVELLAKAIKGEPLPDVRLLRPEVSAALAYVLSLMCAPRPEERPSSPDAVVELFKRAKNGTLDVPKELRGSHGATRKGWRGLLAASMVAAAILVVGLVGWMVIKVPLMTGTRGEQRVLIVTNTINQVTMVTNIVGLPVTVNDDGRKKEQSSLTNQEQVVKRDVVRQDRVQESHTATNQVSSQVPGSVLSQVPSEPPLPSSVPPEPPSPVQPPSPAPPPVLAQPSTMPALESGDTVRLEKDTLDKGAIRVAETPPLMVQSTNSVGAVVIPPVNQVPVGAAMRPAEALPHETVSPVQVHSDGTVTPPWVRSSHEKVDNVPKEGF